MIKFFRALSYYSEDLHGVLASGLASSTMLEEPTSFYSSADYYGSENSNRMLSGNEMHNVTLA